MGTQILPAILAERPGYQDPEPVSLRIVRPTYECQR